MTPVPEDLNKPAIKLLRHLQSLPDDKTYVIILIKHQGEWRFSILNEAGSAIRVAK